MHRSQTSRLEAQVEELKKSMEHSDSAIAQRIRCDFSNTKCVCCNECFFGVVFEGAEFRVSLESTEIGSFASELTSQN